MDVLEAIKGRRSIRAFKSQNVSAEIIEKLVDAARWAPSAGNIQPWEFIIVRKPEIKRRLAQAALGETFIEEASVVIVVCANENRSFEGYGMRGKTLYCIQDTAAAIQNIHLAAYSLGLGTCWIGALLLAAYNPDSDTFETVTKCGTGFTDEDLAKLPKMMQKHVIPHKHPRVNSMLEADVWFEPVVVIEILGAEITLSPIHTCAMDAIRKRNGLAIRFPRFSGGSST